MLLPSQQRQGSPTLSPLEEPLLLLQGLPQRNVTYIPLTPPGPEFLPLVST